MYFRFNMLRPPAHRQDYLMKEIIRFYAKKPVREIKNMPAGMIKLIKNKKISNIWPPPLNITEFTIRCSQANVTSAEIEAFLLKSSAKPRRIDKVGLGLFDNWMENKSEDNALHFLLHFEKRLLANPDMKIDEWYNRVSFLTSIWRLLMIMEDSLEGDKPAVNTVNLLQNFSQRCKTEFSLDDIDLYFTLAKLQISKEVDVPGYEMQLSLAKLTRNLNFTPCKSLSLEFPRCLQFSDYESLLRKLDNDKIVDTCRISFQLSLSGLQWQKSIFSSSLEYLSNSTFLFLYKFSTIEYKTNASVWEEVLVHLCEVWWLVCRSACQHNMEPAIEYLLTQTRYFQQEDDILGGLPSYILLISAEFNDKKEIAANIKIPYKERHPKFEKCFTVETMTDETKWFFINHFVKTLIEERETENNKPVSSAPADAEVVDSSEPGEVDRGRHDQNEEFEEFQDVNVQYLSPEVQRDLLDVKLLENVVKRRGNQVLDIFITSAKEGLLPHDETVEAMIQLFSSTEDLDSLNLLFRSTPDSFMIRELFYHEISQIQIRRIIEKWQEGNRLDAWIEIVEYYRALLNDRKEELISLKAAEKIIQKVRQFCKLIIEDNMRGENGFLAALRSGSLRVASEHGDVYLLLTYWEALFFSPKFEHQTKADQLLHDIPQLVPVIKMDAIISRAEKYNNEELFRKLVEINLRYDGTEYNKSRSFEALLSFLTKSDRIKAGQETIKTAKSLNIRITADYMADFLKVKEERKNKKGILQSFAAYFKKKGTQE